VLKVAIPNKGILSGIAAEMLAEAGYVGRRDPRSLHVIDEPNGVEFYYLRPRDIATYVGSGALDVGITGRDLLLDSMSDAVELDELGFGDSTFRFASLPGAFNSVKDLNGIRVATSYSTLVTRFLATHNVSATLIQLDGAVESAIRLGVADAIADVVSTGSTLKSQGLEIFGPVILESVAVLVSANPNAAGIDVLRRRLAGVNVARQFVLMDYDLPVSLVDAASIITPGLESPTISPLRDPDWVAVRVMVPHSQMNRVMDELYELGARAILVSAIHAARI
jgi:ATP phosphoribosyltransferase